MEADDDEKEVALARSSARLLLSLEASVPKTLWQASKIKGISTNTKKLVHRHMKSSHLELITTEACFK